MATANDLAAAVDATLDEAQNLLDGKDLSGLDPDIQQALALVQSAGTSVDELLETLGVPDPDEKAEPSSTDGDGEDETNSKRSAPPTENLIRATAVRGAMELRDADADAPVLFGYFSRYNAPYEIDSYWEGRFIEQIAPGAFDATIAADRGNMRVLFDHGFDPQLGNKPLGPISELKSDLNGAYYEVPLLDTDYNRNFVLPALRGLLMDGTSVGSQLGASFRFQITAETWNYDAQANSWNPEGLPVRTITAARVFEFGPVTFPASPSASAGVRSLTDQFIDKLHHDPLFVARMTERVGPAVVERMLKAMPGVPRSHPAAPTPHEGSPDGRPKARTQSQRRALAILAGAYSQEGTQ